jgi:hypothetical protein
MKFWKLTQLSKKIFLHSNLLFKLFYSTGPCPLYYKPMMIVNVDSRVINKLEVSLTDDARVIIYDRHMLIAQAIGFPEDYHKSFWYLFVFSCEIKPFMSNFFNGIEYKA